MTPRGLKITIKESSHAGKHAELILDDGTVLEGAGFGGSATVFGEIVFNTGMVGYTEALTDPSYNGQILTLTYPLVGNYGVPDPSALDVDGIPRFFESGRIQARGLVVHELSLVASHWNMHMTLDEWMHGQGIPGISGLDTRALTKGLRTGGVMMAALAVSDSEIDTDLVRAKLAESPRYTSEQFMGAVSTKSPRAYGYGGGGGGAKKADAKEATKPGGSDGGGGGGAKKADAKEATKPGGSDGGGEEKRPIVVIDTGAKYAILRNVRSLGYGAILVPWDTPYEDVMSYDPAGVVISSGPGDPENCKETIQTAARLMKNDVPTLGICLGAQILGLAGSARTYKLKYGHRGQNKPCTNLETGQTYVTSQNHGYGISPDSLQDSEFDLWFSNADDGTVEGIKHRSSRCIAVQFHPEASPGPYDCRFVFENLRDLIEGPGEAAGGRARDGGDSSGNGVGYRDSGSSSSSHDSSSNTQKTSRLQDAEEVITATAKE